MNARRLPHATLALALASVALAACGSVTQDLGNDDDASPAVVDSGMPQTLVDSSAPDSAKPVDASHPDTTAPADATCVPATCVSLGRACGSADDGCGHTIPCGTCTGNATCSDGGACVPNTECIPRTCAEQSVSCGPTGDGCGGLLQCGTCTGPMTCGANGLPGQCGLLVDGGGACVPLTCAELNVTCGQTGDGCGNAIQCGTCTPPQTCGGGDAGPSRCG